MHSILNNSFEKRFFRKNMASEIDKAKMIEYNAEMAQHAEGVAQFLNEVLGGRFITKDQARETMDFLIAKTKRDIESCPNATREEKDAEIHRRELILNTIKASMGL